ncbi:CaiB/BaiF CoA transferase family protein [Burkholderia catarinensis]|uniref:CaiB/BaiF CoA transferase family protein n=1 Tax=Burkholderia catarinensis TaxID=1108140 RepID=UPI00091FD970|nr:CoA transferase [Burkholderia catarinensis]KAG8153614.1 formyl-CoA transferase [Burkholderia catarinensis]
MKADNIFSDLKVVDLASYIAGPAATTILSDYGADVIKVEPPGQGDPYRQFYATPPNPVCERNYAWQLTNRNKRSLAVDLKHPAAKDVLARLVEWADVLVTNFPPKVKHALGLTYEQVGPLNPRLVYADITGYGAHGPEADRPGFDITAYWARTGLMEVTHDAGSPPTLPIPGIGDHATASTLYSAIVTGLYRREKTGRGGHVGTSLIAEGAWAAAAWIEGGLNGARFFGQHNRKNPPNALLNPYRTADDRWVLLVAAQEKDWPGFVGAVGLPDLPRDPRFADVRLRVQHAAALVEILDPVFASRPLAEWKQALDAQRVIYGVVQIAEEIVNDPQMHENGVFLPIDDPAVGARHTVASPLHVADTPKEPPRRAPRLGEHTRSVLATLGFSAADTDGLLQSGAVRQEGAD